MPQQEPYPACARSGIAAFDLAGWWRCVRHVLAGPAMLRHHLPLTDKGAKAWCLYGERRVPAESLLLMITPKVGIFPGLHWPRPGNQFRLALADPCHSCHQYSPNRRCARHEQVCDSGAEEWIGMGSGYSRWRGRNGRFRFVCFPATLIRPASQAIRFNSLLEFCMHDDVFAAEERFILSQLRQGGQPAPGVDDERACRRLEAQGLIVKVAEGRWALTSWGAPATAPCRQREVSLSG